MMKLTRKLKVLTRKLQRDGKLQQASCIGHKTIYLGLKCLVYSEADSLYIRSFSESFERGALVQKLWILKRGCSLWSETRREMGEGWDNGVRLEADTTYS